MPVADIETLSIDTIRCLAMDAVQKANAGHPGTAMALAPVAYVLYRERMRHDPADPEWADRDRFVLSAGHACILQYAALHLSGYDLTLDDLKQFRQWGSRTPGHPEIVRGEQLTPGVEISTGPLGQGVGNAVGMALAEAMLEQRYNGDGEPLVNHRTYAICSDGDVMEGVSGEASSLAGFLELGKLCLIYDDNHITIEGSTGLAFGEDVGLRYEAYGFHVQRLADGWTTDDLRAALDAADAETERPSLIIVRTHIAIGAPHAQDTPESHGAPLGEEEVRLTKQAYGWDPDRTFYVPSEVYEHFDQRERGARRARRLGRAARRPAGRRSGARRRVRPRALGRAARGLGGCPAGLHGSRRAGDARELGRLHRRARGRDPRVHRRLGRPRALEQHARSRATRRSPAHRSRTRRTRRPTRCCRAAWAGARCTSASASTAWARSSTASSCTADSARSARRSSCSPTTCGPPCASPASWSCRSSTSGRTTRSDSARTARRTSRSSTSRRCARCRTCA